MRGNVGAGKEDSAVKLVEVGRGASFETSSIPTVNTSQTNTVNGSKHSKLSLPQPRSSMEELCMGSVPTRIDEVRGVIFYKKNTLLFDTTRRAWPVWPTLPTEDVGVRCLFTVAPPRCVVVAAPAVSEEGPFTGMDGVNVEMMSGDCAVGSWCPICDGWRLRVPCS